MPQKLVRVVTLASRRGRYGGPYDTANRQTRIAQENGFDAFLMAGALNNDEPDVKLAGNETHVYFPVKMRLKKFGFMMLFSKPAFTTLSRHIKSADIVHVSAAREIIPLAAITMSILYKKPFVVQPHGMLTNRTSFLHRMLDLVVRPLVSRARVIIALTESEKSELSIWLGRTPARISVLGNPVPSEVETVTRHFPVENSALFIARLHPRKRVDVFIEAARIAQSHGWPEQYIVAGPDEGDLNLVKRGLNSISNLSYVGTLNASEVTSRVQMGGVFVLPSENEPWGNVLATAIAAGIPVIVSKSAALAPFVSRYAAGLVTPDGDAECLAYSVHSVLSKESSYSDFSRGSVRMTEEMLSPKAQANRLMTIYESALNQMK